MPRTRKTSTDSPARMSIGGGLQVSERTRRPWRWNGDPQRLSAPVRCKREQLYFVEARPADADIGRAFVVVAFLEGERALRPRAVELRPLPGRDGQRFGWFQTPEEATHLRLGGEFADGPTLAEVILRPVAERDPKCHPLANVPRWSVYQPPRPIERIELPRELAGLENALAGLPVKVVREPTSKAALARRASDAALVIPASWVAALGLTLADLEQLAAQALVVIDLATMAQVASAAGAAQTECVTYRSAHELMSARVEYADLATRGFALQDVFPYGTHDADGAFATRVLRATRSWKSYAQRSGHGALLLSETPWENRCHDVLSTSEATGAGELVATDVPWLAAGALGTPVAPAITEHLLRMHVGAPLDDCVQYWNRWDEEFVLVRDGADLVRRYAPLRTAQWLAPDRGAVALGLVVPAARGVANNRLVLLRTGRIDNAGPHDGLPAEPMMMLMKWLARESREETAWAQRHLRDVTVAWQFDTLAGQRFAVQYESAQWLTAAQAAEQWHLHVDDRGRFVARGPQGQETVAAPAVGVFGENSHQAQAALTAWVMRVIEERRVRR